MPTTVVNKKHYRYDEYIGRGSVCGNPFSHIPSGTKADFVVKTREESIACHRGWVRGEGWVFQRFPELNSPYWQQRRQAILDYLPRLAGKRLGCFCKPLACHGDTYVELLIEKGLENG